MSVEHKLVSLSVKAGKVAVDRSGESIETFVHEATWEFDYVL